MRNHPGKHADEASPHKVRVWDLPTRVFHWLLASAVAALFVTGKMGGDAMDWHARFGWLTGTLLLFRLIWGVVGGQWSRFANFVPRPRSVLAYVQARRDRRSIGHNPLGAVSVLAMLVVLLTQVGTGLFSASLDEFAGPLNALVTDATGKAITRYHRNAGQLMIIALVALHVAAIGLYRWRLGHELVVPMILGDKEFGEGVPASRDDSVSRLLALVILAACAALMSWIWALGGA